MEAEASHSIMSQKGATFLEKKNSDDQYAYEIFLNKSGIVGMYPPKTAKITDAITERRGAFSLDTSIETTAAVP